MVAVPLGMGAYKRLYGGTPEVKLLNRWLEANPANLREGVAILARPGTTNIQGFSKGDWSGYESMRGNYAINGLFDDSLFVVCGTNLYRIKQDMSVILIDGTINGTGSPEVTWQRGTGYERLWIADGQLLQYYEGTSKAKASLTLDGVISNGVDIFEIGGSYYKWGTTFSDTDDGTSDHPYVINPLTSDAATGTGATATASISSGAVSSFTVTAGGTDYDSAPEVRLIGGGGTGASATATINDDGEVDSITVDEGGSGYTSAPTVYLLNSGYDPMNQMILAIMNSGTAGVDYSSTITVQNPLVTAAASTKGVTYIEINQGGSGYTSAPTVVFSGGGGGSGATATATVENGAIQDVTINTPGSGYTTEPIISFSGGGGTGATATATVGTPSTTNTVVFTAVDEGTDGNSITLTVTGGTHLTASSSTLINGGLDYLVGCEVPDGKSPITVAQTSSYVLVGIADSQQFYWIQPGETSINALDYASKESNPDNITQMRTVGDMVLIIGEKSTENWYATGDDDYPFKPMKGRVYARGAIPGSAVVIDDGVMFIGDDGRVYSVGYGDGSTDVGDGIARVSNNGIEERIRRQLRREDGLTP